MVRQPVTRLQLSARRFHARRMRHALVRRDVAMHDDPLRAQSLSLAVGGVLAAVAVVAGAVLALVRPQGLPDSAPILLARETGALYVRVGDTLHPVANLASARLVARTAASPVAVAQTAIARAKRGPMVGIAGAPASIGGPARGDGWTVCDGDRTVVTVGDVDLRALDPARPVLVTPRGESAATTYLLYDGQRASVDLRSLAVIRALRLDGVAPIPISRTLLDVVPEAPAIAAPVIGGAGAPGPRALRGATVGSVVQVHRSDAVERYVVLPGGVQSVGEVTADLIRFAYDGDARPVASVAPATIAALPIVDDLPVQSFPLRSRAPVGLADGLGVCAHWRPEGSAPSSNAVVLTGRLPQPDPALVTDLAQADGDGPNVDAVVMAGGTSAYVRSARIVGDDGTGPRFLVTDGGVAFGVHDDDAATALGLVSAPGAAPWPVLAHLPRGPELSTAAASVARDGLAPSS
jgi:type VII secretion protein EccB